jgi:cyclophilin family peptidyl-prolyl cis-trans isomerase
MMESDSGDDQVLPLYSEAYRLIGSLDNYTDEGEFADDLSSTCSPQNRPPSTTLKSSASVVSTDSSRFWSRAFSARRALHEELNERNDEGYWSTHNTLVFTARKRKNPIYLAVVIFSMLGFLLYSQSHATLHNALNQVTQLIERRRQVHLKFRNVEQDMKRLQLQMLELNEEHTTAGVDGGIIPTSDAAGKDEITVLHERLRAGNSRLGSLQRHLQDVSRRDAINKYGAGVIRVELELEFPDGKEGPSTLVIEMAPLDLMPHSVYMFLEMVHAGLFDGCSFILNAMHVIKAAPLPYDGSSASAKVKAFTKQGLESVAFREYSADYPHEQYTVGFAADGSPSFYINTQDNTDIHVGDPCFAKIISGLATVERLEASPTRNGIWYRQRIGLKRATIL